MNVQREYGAAVAACLALWLSFDARAVLGADVVPQKQSLVIPITTLPPRSVACVIAFDRSVPTTAVAFSPDGKTLAAAGYREVVIWDLESAKLLKRIGSGQLGTSIGALTFLKEGSALAIGEGTPSSSGAVRIFDMASGQQNGAFEDPGDVVYCLALSPDGKLLAGGAADGSAHVWSVDEKRLVTTIPDHDGWVLGASFSSDGKLLATASADRTARVWEVGTWKSVVSMSDAETLHGVAFSADGRLLALAVGGPEHRAVRLRRKDNGKPTRTISTGAGMPLDTVWIARGNNIYAPCSDNTVKAYNAGNGRLAKTFSGHADWVYCVALNADATQLASGSADGTVKVWSAADAKLLATLVQLAPQSDEWLVLTRQGYLAISRSSALKWKTANVKTPQEKLTAILEKPALVRRAIAGKKVEPPGIE